MTTVFLAIAPALADEYPAKAIKLVVPYPSGGANDIFARLIGQKLTASLGKPVVIDNKSGASTMLGSDFVAKSPADGYTLLPYKLDDFTAVAPVATTGIWLTVNPALPVKSVADLVAYVKSNQGKVNYASSGRGGATHLISEHFDKQFGIAATGVEYRGSSPLITDLLAGQVQYYFFPVNGSMEFLRSGQLRAIAVTSEKRLEAAPDIPTFQELGHPEMNATIMYGIWGPAGLPQPILERLNREIGAAVQSDEVRARFTGEGAAPMTAAPAAFQAAYRQNVDFWEGIIHALALELD